MKEDLITVDTRYSMPVIETRYIPATDKKGSRVKATSEKKSVIIPFGHDCSIEAAHERAAREWLKRHRPDAEAQLLCG